MTQAIDIRTQLAALVVSSLAIAAGSVSAHKLDRVERFPSAAVYVSEVLSERDAMQGLRSRTAELRVAVYREAAGDVTSDLAADAVALEAAVEVARNGGTFAGLADGIEMTRAIVDPLPDSNGKRGVLVMTFEARYAIALSQA